MDFSIVSQNVIHFDFWNIFANNQQAYSNNFAYFVKSMVYILAHLHRLLAILDSHISHPTKQCQRQNSVHDRWHRLDTIADHPNHLGTHLFHLYAFIHESYIWTFKLGHSNSITVCKHYLQNSQHKSFHRWHSVERATRYINLDVELALLLHSQLVRMMHLLWKTKLHTVNRLTLAHHKRRCDSRFLSSFLPQPITVHIVPGCTSFRPAGGKHTGNKCSWKATRVANYVA